MTPFFLLLLKPRSLSKASPRFNASSPHRV
jgi:hypothetical protein